MRSFSTTASLEALYLHNLDAFNGDQPGSEGNLVLSHTVEPIANNVSTYNPPTFASFMADFSHSQLAYYAPNIDGNSEIQPTADAAISNFPDDTFDRAATRRVSQICPLRYYRDLSPELTITL